MLVPERKPTARSEAEIPAPVAWAMQKAPALRLAIYFFWRIAIRWTEDQCPLKAAAMAFFGLVSIFPMVLAAVSILATTLSGSEAALTAFQHFVEQFFPGESGQDVSIAMKNAVDKIAGGPSVTVVSLLALGSLLWSGRAFFQTLAEVLNSVWPGASARTFWESQVVLWGTFVGAGVLWLLSTTATFVVAVINWLLKALPDLVFDRLALIEIISRVIGFLLTILMFGLIYRFLPNVQGRRRKRLVWGAALVAGLAWELAKIVFTRFLGDLNRYQTTYGSVAGVIVTMMWIYVSSLIILFGAEAAAAYEETCENLLSPEAKQMREAP